MTQVSRRGFFGMTAAGAALTACARAAIAAPQSASLQPLTANAQPITAGERAARIAKVQGLMQQQKVSALLVEAGSSLDYFTGITWWRSERTTAALIPVQGKTVVVTPFFEVPSVQESLKIDADIRPWHEDQSPFALIADALKGATPADGPLAVEATTRAFIIEGVRKASARDRQVILGDELVNACRMIKTPAELALMQAANDVTIAALKHLHAKVDAGMSGADIMNLLVATTNALGGKHEFSLVLLNEASAYPHGSNHPQVVREGSVILVDTGCKVHGYSSDISRTWIYGRPSDRQREVWNTVKRGQEIALETAKIGLPVGELDVAVRAYYEGLGWAKNYGLPGTSHRTGHGIGMDGHEPPNLMRADRTPLQAGMCFSDEPGIYIPGEFGIRMEDIWTMTEQGPKLFTPLARSIDDPI
ncbi:MAG: M24 family metallopeptidase [Reyranella sp.]|uniref:M24 family metallopeptidase n=1 Tax=Reyranella sp. TaxID=1929291 RepID=UPI003D14AEC6